jgi:hypothetical protein
MLSWNTRWQKESLSSSNLRLGPAPCRPQDLSLKKSHQTIVERYHMSLGLSLSHMVNKMAKSTLSLEMAPAPSRGHPHTPSSAGGR